MRNLGKMAALLAGTMLAAAPANATWREAKTRHFVIYSEQKPAEIQAFAKKLETFDAVVRKMLVMRDPEPNAGTRLTVFVVDSVDGVQKLAGDSSGTIAGFYIPRAEGSIAVVPRDGTAGGANALKADTIFFHEYTHHMMLQGADKVYPKWLVEGYAEFLGTVKFAENGQISLGRAASHRMYELALGTKLSYDRLLSNEPIAPSDPTSTSIYGRSWIMTHYFLLSGERKGQLTKYLDLMNAGKDGRTAAEEAFGSLKKLNGEFESYYRKPSLPIVSFASDSFPVPPVTIRDMTASEQAVLPSRMQSKVGVDKVKGQRVLADIRQVAAQYPNDPLVQVSLAEAELDVRNYGQAIAAADRALALNPKSVEGMVFKGRALIEDPARVADAAAFKQARELFVGANKVETEDPEPLKYYWESFRRQKAKATPNAAEAIHYAASLVPMDMDVRMDSALQYLQDGKGAEARARLIPIAFNAHGGKAAEKGQEMINKIDAKDVPGALAIAEEMFKKAEEEEAKAAAGK